MSWKNLLAEDVMNAPVLSIETRAGLDEAVTLLSENEISGAPVVDERGHPVGVISLHDIVVAIAGRESDLGQPGGYYFQSYPVEANLEVEEEDKLAEIPVGEAMTPWLVSVEPTLPLPEVVDRMVERSIHRVLVVSRKNELLGVISTMDILRTLANSP